MVDKKDISIQKEIGESSGLVLLINKNKKFRLRNLEKISNLGFEIRPIVAGNFTRNRVIEYFDFEIFGDLKNANIFVIMVYLLAIIQLIFQIILKGLLIYN